MRRFVLVVAVVGLLASAGGSTASAQSESRQVLLTTDCSHTILAIRPHVIGVSCDRTFKFYGIHWKRWGRPIAIGIGHARLQGCTPFCAVGRVIRPQAKIRLTHVVTVAGIWMYARLNYSLIGPLPEEFHRRQGVLNRLPDH